MTEAQIASHFPGLRLLVVEDLVALAIQYKTIAKRLEVDVVTAGTVAQAKRQIAEGPWHAALVDLNLPDGSGFDVLAALLRAEPACSVVVITAEDSLDNAVRASEAGAFDFIEKPVEAERLLVTLRNALHAAQLSKRVASLQVEAPRQFEQFLGQSAEMQTVYRMIEMVAVSNAPVCITGESGTGKELAANAIHARSPRKNKNLVAINCAAIPKDLIESELFGHGKGAFTGAVTERLGVFMEADKGTLFLDEIAELDLNVQAKLLRVLQTGEVKRLGEDKTRIVDVRIVCATHRKLSDQVRKGAFREDLFYRLFVVPIDLPPLRVRGGDVGLIARDMLLRFAKEDNKQFKDFSSEAMAALTACAWPGNVRELINVVRAVVALYDGSTVQLDMLPASVRDKYSEPTVLAFPAEATPSAPEVSWPPALPTQLATSTPGLAQPGVQAAELPVEPPWFSQTESPDFIAPAASSASFFDPDPLPRPIGDGAYKVHESVGTQPVPVPAGAPNLPQSFLRDRVRPLQDVERDAVDYALRAYGGNVSKAARALQVNPSTLYRKIQVWTTEGEGLAANP